MLATLGIPSNGNYIQVRCLREFKVEVLMLNRPILIHLLCFEDIEGGTNKEITQRCMPHVVSRDGRGYCIYVIGIAREKEKGKRLFEGIRVWSRLYRYIVESPSTTTPTLTVTHHISTAS